jgi:hypothetical protein
MIKLKKRFQSKKLTKEKKKKEWASNMKGKKIKGWNWKRKQIQKLS